jgi:hypothetical protein
MECDGCLSAEGEERTREPVFMIYTITVAIIHASRPAADRTMVIVKVQQTSVKQGAFL